MKHLFVCLLTTAPLTGLGALLLLFLLSFLLVHVAKLAFVGYRQYKKQDDAPAAPPPEQQEKKAKPKALPAPVYYLVEKKKIRKKPKTKYEEPKRINFEE